MAVAIEAQRQRAGAPAHRPVLARVREVVLADDVLDRWGVEVDVRPPGYEWRAPML